MQQFNSVRVNSVNFVRVFMWTYSNKDKEHSKTKKRDEAVSKQQYRGHIPLVSVQQFPPSYMVNESNL